MIQGAPETPKGHLKAYPNYPVMALFRFHHTETLCIKVFGYGGIDLYLFDISKGVYDPNDTNRGPRDPQRPPEVT